MLRSQDVFDEDQVRSDYVSKVKLYGEKHCDHFEWVIATVDNQTREGIRYYFGQSYVDWYIPNDNKGIEAYVVGSKLKHSILKYLVKQNS